MSVCLWSELIGSQNGSFDQFVFHAVLNRERGKSLLRFSVYFALQENGTNVLGPMEGSSHSLKSPTVCIHFTSTERRKETNLPRYIEWNCTLFWTGNNTGIGAGSGAG